MNASATTESVAFSRKLLFAPSFVLLFLALLSHGSVFFVFMLPFVFALISIPQYIVGGIVDQRLPRSRLRPWLHLTPTIIFSVWFVWFYSFWRVPEILFKDHLMTPIPQSVAKLKGYVANLDISWKANLYFEISPEDFWALVKGKGFTRINRDDPRFKEILDRNMFFWDREGWPAPDTLNKPELYLAVESRHVISSLLADGEHRHVYFQKHKDKTIRKYIEN